MALRNYGFIDNALLSTLHDMMDIVDDSHGSSSAAADKNLNAPSRVYVRDAEAMARTPTDIKEYPNSYQFIVDMPGVTPSEVKVQLDENDDVLVVSGERKRDLPTQRERKEVEGNDHGLESAGNGNGMKYLRMERRMGKFMRKFVMPENANKEAITAVCRDGVLTVNVEKLPPPEPKKPKTIDVKVV